MIAICQKYRYAHVAVSIILAAVTDKLPRFSGLT